MIDSAPATPENVAEITAVPLPTLVTRPVDDTVATAVFDDDHVAELVTSSSAPPDTVAVAVNCALDPTSGAPPVTLIVVIVVGAAGDFEPQAAAERPSARTHSRTTDDWIFMTAPCRGAGAGTGTVTSSETGDVWRNGCESTTIRRMTDRIAAFLESIGLPCRRGTIVENTILPGILIQDGGLIYDVDTLKYPGDLLHEAGHLAVMAPERRLRARPNVGKYAAEEMMAIAWSYAAAVHLGLDPSVVFHDDGYRGGAAAVLAAFAAEPPMGVPMLQWLGMTMDAKNARAAGVAPYPAMIRWLNDGSCAAATETFK